MTGWTADTLPPQFMEILDRWSGTGRAYQSTAEAVAEILNTLAPIPDIEEATSVRLNPGDVLFVRPHMDITPNQAREYGESLQVLFPDNRVIVTAGPADLAVLRMPQ
jgi:hypothetical protein